MERVFVKQRADFSDKTIIFGNNFSNIISVSVPWEIVINKNSQEFGYFYFINMFIVDLNFEV